jgi:hypothetical protein
MFSVKMDILAFFSSITNSNWDLQQPAHGSYSVQFEDRQFLSTQKGEWTDRYNRTYWYVLFEPTDAAIDSLIVQEFDLGVVIAHCPRGINDINRQAVNELTSKLVREPSSAGQENTCHCNLL